MYLPEEFDNWAAEQFLISVEQSGEKSAIEIHREFAIKVNAIIHSPMLSDGEKVSQIMLLFAGA